MNTALKMLILDSIAILIFAAFFIWASKRKDLWKALNADFWGSAKNYCRECFKKLKGP